MAQEYWRVKRNGKWSFVPKVIKRDDGTSYERPYPECECYFCTKRSLYVDLSPKGQEQSTEE